MEYNWKNQEASFGLPRKKQVKGGTHITCEIILKKENEYIALRRPKGIPEHELPLLAKKYPQGLVYFCHNLIGYGESMEECVRKIVKVQANISVQNMKVVSIDSFVQKKDKQWAFTSHIIAEVNKAPEINAERTEVITFKKENPPSDMALWTKKELQEFLQEYD